MCQYYVDLFLPEQFPNPWASKLNVFENVVVFPIIKFLQKAVPQSNIFKRPEHITNASDYLRGASPKVEQQEAVALCSDFGAIPVR